MRITGYASSSRIPIGSLDVTSPVPDDRPSALIESWLPFATVGGESLRERGVPGALPPLYFLHVWWARRPLTVSRAAILAILLTDYERIADDLRLREGFPDDGAYRA